MKSLHERIYENTILIFIAWLVVGRFFTERFVTRHVLKPFQFIDLVFVPFLFLLSIPYIMQMKSDRDKTGFFVFASILWFTISAVLNYLFYSRLLVWAYLLFVIDVSLGPLFYLSLKGTIRDKKAFAQKLLNLLYYLGFVEIVFFFFFNLPEFIKTGNPDRVTGTFGWNGYQLTIFLVIWDAIIIAKMHKKHTKPVFAILLLAWSVAVTYLAQFRAGLVFYFIAIGYITYTLYGKNATGKIKALILSSTFILLFVGIYSSGKVPTMRWEDVMTFVTHPKYVLETGKAKYAIGLLKMYRDNPFYAVFGGGPGNHSSRAFDTFAAKGNPRRKNVSGASKLAHKLPFTPYKWTTDLSRKYTAKITYFTIMYNWGSGTIAAPRASWISIPAETGIIGLFLVLLMYFNVLKLQKSLKDNNDTAFTAYYAGIAATIYIFFLGSLNNWWETGRIMILLWTLYYIVWAAGGNQKEHEK